MAVSVSSDCALLADDAKHACVVEYEQNGQRTVKPQFGADSMRLATTGTAGELARHSPEAAEFVLFHSASCGACTRFMPIWLQWCAHCADLGISCRAVSDDSLFPVDVGQVPAVVYTIGGRRAPAPSNGDMVQAIISVME